MLEALEAGLRHRGRNTLATFRIGQNLNVDYGLTRIRPAPSGTAWFDASKLSQSLGWYLFAGVEGRAVAHNIFGAESADSPAYRAGIEWGGGGERFSAGGGDAG